MNIRRELNRVQRKRDLQVRFSRAFNILRNFLCQHKELSSEIIKCSLGDCEDSIVEEIFGKEAVKTVHNVYLRRVYCVNCGREVYREILDESEVLGDKPENP